MRKLIKGVAFLGGAFDPFHNGHLAIIEKLKSLVYINQVVLIPTYISPHKKGYFFSPKDRLDMLEMIAKDNDVLVNSIEILKPETAYTIDTISALLPEYKSDSLFYVIGSDQFFNLHLWKDFLALTSIVTFIVINRNQFIEKELYSTYLNQHFPSALFNRFQFETMSPVALSSSIIREKIQLQQSIFEMVPLSVFYYINKVFKP